MLAFIMIPWHWIAEIYSQEKKEHSHLSQYHSVNADGLAMQEAMASEAMILIFSWNNLTSALKGLRYNPEPHYVFKIV